MSKDEVQKNSTLSGRGGFKGGIKPKTDTPLKHVGLRLTEEQHKILKDIVTVKFLREILDFCKIDKNLETLKKIIRNGNK